MKKKWSIGWGVEDRCNMNCEFCYSKEVRRSQKFVSLDTYKKFVEKNAEFISSINYGTGENSLSEDWFELVKFIGSNYPAIRQALTTNGHIAKACKDREKLNIFVDYIDEVDISLDFAESLRHNKFRGNPEAYEMAISAFELCKKYNKQTTLVFLGTNEVVQPQNLQGLFEIAHKYNAYLRTNIYRPTQGINEKTKHFVMDYSTLISMLKWISDNHKIIKISDRLIAAAFFKESVEDLSGYSSIRILGDGSITPSTYLISEKYRKYNIADNIKLNVVDFSEQIVRDYIPKDCIECSLCNCCKGGVYDRRLLWYGTLDERDPYCPKRYSKVDMQNILLTTEEKFVSVHDSYLPTMFFAY